MNPDDVTPKYALRWLCEVITHSHGYEYEKKRSTMAR